MFRTRCQTVLVGLALSSMVSPVAAQTVRPHWSEDGQRFWFRSTDGDGDVTFLIVDTADRSCQPAFDHDRVATSLSRVIGKEVFTTELPIDRLDFNDSPDQLLLRYRRDFWQLDLRSYELSKATPLEKEVTETRLFLPPRNSGASGESTNIAVENRLDDPVRMYWITGSGGERRYATIGSGETRQQHTYVGHAWLLKSEDDRPLGCFVARGDDHVRIDEEVLRNVRHNGERRRSRDPRESSRSRRESRDGQWTAFVRDHDLWVRDGDEETQLSTNGTADNSYGRQGGDVPDVRWSPDAKHLVAFQTRVVPERKVYLIESSPSDQLQPRLDSYAYRKPGDELPTPTVHLFSLEEKREIPVSNALFANPWNLRFRGWSENSDCFTLHYNQRGHQTIRILEVNAADGAVRTIIEETSPTFLHYSADGKSVFENLNDDEILWASERSGWNHLYRYSRSSGAVINPVTSGEWNVRRIETIDRDAHQVWFYAVGVAADQDPYHEHFCRVNFDGSGFTVLTEGDGTHKIQFEQDRQYFLDTWSRVDLAPVTELRESQTGELICELQRQDTGQRFGDRRRTERFVAKGRDGDTDIWGVIHWPRDFDESRSYPVVENIYAGPHDQHVPKSFRTNYRHQHRIADAGMIVVQIDGMGTAWRSKAFHDVCYKNLRDAGFPDRIAWLQAAARTYPQMDLCRVGIYGGSAGGQNAMAALLWHNDFYKVAVADCGCHDNRMDKIWWNEQWMGWPVDESYITNSNMENAHLLKGDLMLIVGELDRNVDPASTTQVVAKLVEHNKDFEFVLVPGVGHGAAETPWASRKRLNFLKEHLEAD